MPHAMVIGGSGMLADVCRGLARSFEHVSVVARDSSRLRALCGPAGAGAGSLHPVPVDYRDREAFASALEDAERRFGPPSLLVCYIHSDAPGALEAAARFVSADPPRCRFFHVRGSAAANPARTGDETRRRILAAGQVLYREVVLGFVIGSGRSRWLTHGEIAGGVLEAVRTDSPRFIVGTVEPWSARP